MSSDLRNVIVLGVVVLLASVIGFVPDDEPQVVSSAGPSSGIAIEGEGTGEGSGGQVVGGELVEGEAGSAGSGEGGQGEAGGPGGPNPGAAAGMACEAGRNGGDTDTGVSANRIGLAATIVTTGPGSTFLADSQFGMQAIVAKVNSADGICGRGLDLKLVNDNWEAQRGLGILRNFMNDDSIFALPVVPSSEGLRAAGPEIESKGIPVVGSDGMLIEQYENDWIWPVATATVSQMRVMAKYAFDQGARKFAIVYDEFYRFGVEGKDAYEKYVKKLSGAEFLHAEGIQPNEPGYGANIANVNDALSGECDGNSECALVMLVDPGTANTWISGDENFKTRTQFRFGAQPLFSANFAQDCKARCDGMLVWTGYVPPFGANSGKAGIQEYENDVKTVAPSADTSNQFLQGAYLGMSVFVDALEQASPNLTREGVQQVMNSMTYTSDLASDLTWTESRRNANVRAQAWKINAASGSFDGFEDARTGFLTDPEA